MSDDDIAQMINAISHLGQRSHEVAVYEAFGAVGVDRLVLLLDAVRDVLEHVPFEMMTTGLNVYAAATEDFLPPSLPGMDLASAADLAGRAVNGLAVYVSPDRRLRAWDDQSKPFGSSDPVLTYRFVHRESEDVVVSGRKFGINDTGWECAMATPSFSSLEGALDQYVELNRRPDRCLHLKQVWRDEKRLGLLPRPEHFMRDSLFTALRYSLTGVNVRPEMGQDETKVVDLEVNWFGVKRSAIIEIKWMGDSAPPSAKGTFVTTYRDARAVAGLRQLADYLDRRDGITPGTPVMGYLFIFDARRQSLTPEQKSIDAANGLFYAMRDVAYPASLLARADIGRPYRCFMEPICA